MENQFFDETNGLWYELRDGYYYPCLTVSEDEKQPIGLWGRQHKRYLKEQRPIIYNSLRGITEGLKATNPLTWAGRMNNAQACAREIVNNEIIYN